MKYMLTILTVIQLCAIFAIDEITEQRVLSPVKRAKLYFTSGELQHQTEVKFAKGRNRLIFPNISTYASANSIQFEAEGEFRIVSVVTEIDFLAAELSNPRIKILKDSLDINEMRLQYIYDNIEAYNTEKGVLQANMNLKGTNTSITVVQLKEAAEFYRIRTFEINQQISKLTVQQQKATVKVADYRNQLMELNFTENARSNQVIILLDSEKASTSQIKLTYMVSDCGWTATYDLRAKDLTEKINLKYKAQVYNNTGSDWKDVDLVLSTADPSLDASTPDLNPWFLQPSDFAAKRKMEYKKSTDDSAYRIDNLNSANQRVYEEYNSFDIRGNSDLKKPMQRLENNKQLEQLQFKKTVGTKEIFISELSTEFIIAYKFSCPSDAKPYLVDIKEFNLTADFSHVAVPKISTGAYLIANVVGWQELDLIPGITNVYFAGKYVGQSLIDTRTVSDTLALSLGRDDKITVIRKLREEKTIKKVIGSSKRETYVYDIVVRNNRSIPIKIQIFDQVPVSKHSDVSVSVENISGAKQNEFTGEVEWNLMIAPNEVKSQELSFEVKYPKNMTVSIQRFRTISAPSF